MSSGLGAAERIAALLAFARRPARLRVNRHGNSVLRTQDTGEVRGDVAAGLVDEFGKLGSGATPATKFNRPANCGSFSFCSASNAACMRHNARLACYYYVYTGLELSDIVLPLSIRSRARWRTRTAKAVNLKPAQTGGGTRHIREDANETILAEACP